MDSADKRGAGTDYVQRNAKNAKDAKDAKRRANASPSRNRLRKCMSCHSAPLGQPLAHSIKYELSQRSFRAAFGALHAEDALRAGLSLPRIVRDIDVHRADAPAFAA